MSMYKQFKTDSSLERKGIVHDYGDFRITIARAGGSNKKFARILEVLTKPYRRAIQSEMMDEDLGKELLMTAYARAVVLNWEVKTGTDKKTGEPTWQQGIESPDGSIMEFNEKNLLSTFKNLPDLFTDIQEQASKSALYREQILEEDSGN